MTNEKLARKLALLDIIRFAFGGPFPMPRVRKSRSRPCRHCSAVSVPTRDECPECIRDRRHVEDPFESGMVSAS